MIYPSHQIPFQSSRNLWLLGAVNSLRESSYKSDVWATIQRSTRWLSWNNVKLMKTVSPLDSTRYMSAALLLRHASRADRFHFSLCVTFHQARGAAYLLRPSSSSPEPSGTNTSISGRFNNSAEFSTEQTGSHAPKQQYDIRLLFKIKHPVLKPTYKSPKRDKHKLFC